MRVQMCSRPCQLAFTAITLCASDPIVSIPFPFSFGCYTYCFSALHRENSAVVHECQKFMLLSAGQGGMTEPEAQQILQAVSQNHV